MVSGSGRKGPLADVGSRTPIGRAITNVVTRALEALRVFPQGTTAVSTLLNHAADDLAAAGRAGIFTPLLYAKTRRP